MGTDRWIDTIHRMNTDMMEEAGPFMYSALGNSQNTEDPNLTPFTATLMLFCAFW